MSAVGGSPKDPPVPSPAYTTTACLPRKLTLLPQIHTYPRPNNTTKVRTILSLYFAKQRDQTDKTKTQLPPETQSQTVFPLLCSGSGSVFWVKSDPTLHQRVSSLHFPHHATTPL